MKNALPLNAIEHILQTPALAHVPLAKIGIATDVTFGGAFEATPGRDLFVVDLQELASLPVASGDQPGPRFPVSIEGFDPSQDLVVVENANLGAQSFTFDSSNAFGSLHLVQNQRAAISVQDYHFAGTTPEMVIKVAYTPPGAEPAHTDIQIPVGSPIPSSSFFEQNMLFTGGDVFA